VHAALCPAAPLPSEGPPRTPSSPSASPRSKRHCGRQGDKNPARFRRKFSACTAIRTKDSRRSSGVQPQPHAWAAAFTVEKLDPRFLKRPPQGRQDGPSRLRRPALELTQRNDANLGRPRQIVLRPVEQSAGSTALGWCHGAIMSRFRFSSNLSELAVPRFK
jgi:hypothetical protein